MSHEKRGGVVNESPLILNDESNSPVAQKLRNSGFTVAVSLRILQDVFHSSFLSDVKQI